jgi:hypothetical protein
MKNNTSVTTAFQQVFFTVVCFTLLSGGASCWMASQKGLTHEQSRIFEICNTTWSMGVGAIFGLLGGKALEILNSDQE